ncbi:3-isopropylmalate dehydratase large subunit [Natranaerofaba carboxydovora]|uniref:3-isopropylmalate dehydratase large subunit n=1 Tax=Natranaerofaba carboxydovora TaxID=2742683 RepID=UPI001F1366FA|nr:3-isopropylmalate dehydratase large subunit [Natranaerofaba carboxydovora]UMZ73435.1 Homoaconitase large subunit [Natranaerofaba carboxydovora]
MSNNKPMHAIEKILAKHAGKETVSTGEIINCEVDVAEVNDLYLQTIRSFYEIGGKKVKHPDRIAFVMDHYAPAPTIQSADNQKAMREFVWDQDIKHLFEINEGVCHQVLIEAGLIQPGKIIVETDSHTTIMGAFGAVGTGVGATDMASIMLTGELWFRVPEIIKINIDGNLKDGVMAKDIILNILGELKQNIAVYKGVEFSGEAVKSLTLAERMVLCNMAVEMGAKTSYIEPDEKVFDYVKSKTEEPFTVFETDSGYEYNEEYNFSVDELTPQAAFPGSIDDVHPINNCEGEKVDQVLIGTCTGGRVEDFEIAAKIIGDKKIDPKCRLVAVPASKGVLLEITRKGILEKLTEAGAAIVTPGCGPCLGAHEGVLAPGEVCTSTSSRNFPGRMGSRDARIYSVSPATAATTALNGKITDPRNVI